MCSFIKTEIVNNTGFICLDRPNALNALTLDMIQTMAEVIREWESNSDIHCIVLESEHPKVFCAGGDMKHIRQLALDQQLDEAEAFFNEEYALNLAISQLKTPYVSLIDGICIGGGIGLTIHGRYRIASEKAGFIMPECKLGFFPDVGGSHFLSRMPYHLGFYLALTGERVTGPDSLIMGYATHYVASERIAELRSVLAANGSECDHILERFKQDPEPGPLRAILENVETVFSAQDLPALNRALDEIDNDWSIRTRKQLASGSPVSIHTTWKLLHRGLNLDLRTCLEAELATARLMTPHPDFIEGARAILVDKDHAPKWTKASIF